MLSTRSQAHLRFAAAAKRSGRPTTMETAVTPAEIDLHCRIFQLWRQVIVYVLKFLTLFA
jgi:hypothetical protein